MGRRLVGAVLAAVTLIGSAGAAQAGAGRTEEPRATGWYLALGDSLAAGYQPGAGDDRDGGYVGDVLATVQESAPKTKLVNLACSGATTVSMVEGDRCAYEEGTQLAQAVEFLHAHARNTRLVTLDVGANDITSCARPAIDPVCAAAALQRINTNLGRILTELRAAAGPDVEIVVLNYYNPFLAAWLTGASGQALATASSGLQAQLNGIIAGRAASVGAEVADVSTAFESTNWTPTASAFGSLPTNVVRICTWTWMCTRGDIHANDAGYAVLAAAVEARLLQPAL